MKTFFMRICLNCDKIKEVESIHVLNETETYCEECIMNEIKEKTNNLIILNEWEKSKKKLMINITKRKNKFKFKYQKRTKINYQHR